MNPPEDQPIDPESNTRKDRPLLEGEDQLKLYSFYFGNIPNKNLDPRSESFFKMIRKAFLPKTVFKSFTFYLTLAYVSVFVLQLALGTKGGLTVRRGQHPRGLSGNRDFGPLDFFLCNRHPQFEPEEGALEVFLLLFVER